MQTTMFYYSGNIFFHFLILSLSLWLTSKVVPGFRIQNFAWAIASVLLIAALTYFSAPYIAAFLAPVPKFPVGLVYFIVTTICLRICGALLRGFLITGWLPAILGAAVFTLLNMVFHYFVGV